MPIVNDTQVDNPTELDTRERTDDVLAETALADGPAVCHDGEGWRQYNGQVWERVNDAVVERRVLDAIITAKIHGVRPTAGRVSSVSSVLRIVTYIDGERFDADPNALVLQNGTLNLRTRELRPHEPGDYVTVALPYDYEPDAVAAALQRFLDSTVPDAAEFLQEFAGYCLTANTSLETAVWLYGPPGCGKSTFISALEAMLCGLAGVLGIRELERSNFALSNVPGKRLLTAAEQPAGGRRITDQINALVSGDMIQIDRKYRDAVQQRSRAKLLWAMNERPKVTNMNDGVYRRVKVVEFPALPEEQRDTKLKARIEREAAGILNWSLAGLERLRERGTFDPPPCVLEATAEFKQDNDIPAQFVAECCVTGTTVKATANDLYKAYEQWCVDSGHRPKAKNSVGKDWTRLGFENSTSNGRAYWQGVGLRT